MECVDQQYDFTNDEVLFALTARGTMLGDGDSLVRTLGEKAFGAAALNSYTFRRTRRGS